MTIVPAGVPLPYDYTAYDMNNGLSVAMKVYDMSSGMAVLVATIMMTPVVNGTYIGMFTAVAGKPYLINKMVYTDLGIWNVPNGDYSPGSETIQASTFESDIIAATETISEAVSGVETATAGLILISGDLTTEIQAVSGISSTLIDVVSGVSGIFASFVSGVDLLGSVTDVLEQIAATQPAGSFLDGGLESSGQSLVGSIGGTDYLNGILVEDD